MWRKLPGRWPLKLVEAVVLTAAVCLFLVAVVFPWVEPKLPFSDNTVDGSGDSSATPSSSATPTPTAPSPTDVPSPSRSGGSGGTGSGDELAGE